MSVVCSHHWKLNKKIKNSHAFLLYIHDAACLYRKHWQNIIRTIWFSIIHTIHALCTYICGSLLLNQCFNIIWKDKKNWIDWAGVHQTFAARKGCPCSIQHCPQVTNEANWPDGHTGSSSGQIRGGRAWLRGGRKTGAVAECNRIKAWVRRGGSLRTIASGGQQGCQKINI